MLCVKQQNQINFTTAVNSHLRWGPKYEALVQMFTKSELDQLLLTETDWSQCPIDLDRHDENVRKKWIYKKLHSYSFE